MNKRTKSMVIGAAAAAALLGGVGVAVANSADDGIGGVPGIGGRPAVTAEERERAEAAALEHAGGGRVTESEIDDDGGPARYEIEVTLEDGRQVDVDLDEAFRVIGEEREGPEADDDDRWDD